MNGDRHGIDIAGYLLGRVEPEEDAAIATHLLTCDVCSLDLEDLRPTAAALLDSGGPVPEPPAGLEARTLLAVQRAAGAGPRPARRERSPIPFRIPRAVPALAIALVALTVGLAALTRQSEGVEVVATLAGASGQTASVEVTETGIGRVIEFDTRDLPILPKGEYYELWWVGPDDRPGRPDRISAGTFHPDPQGRSEVVFAAAVDPAKYPRLAVTAEPGDGDPAPSRPDVLRGRARPPAS